jgi:hypothetical protein
MLLESVLTHVERKPRLQHNGDLTFKKKGTKWNYGWMNPQTEEFTTRIDGKMTVIGHGVQDGWEQVFIEAHDNFDFERIIPSPDGLLRGGLTMEDRKHPNWHDWNCANWGTKWNSYDYKQDDKGRVYFDTAWSPPTEVIRKLSAMFPNIRIMHEYFDEGWCFWGYDEFLAGEKIKSDRTSSGELDPMGKRLCIELKGYDPDKGEE